MKKKYRIGVLLDGLVVPVWVQELLAYLEADSRFELCCYVVHAGEKAASRSGFVYRVLRALDQRLTALPGNPFRRVQLETGTIPVVKVIPIQKQYSDYFPADAIEAIRKEKPDFLLRFGFRILRGDVLQAARYGILSLHHGDTAHYRGGPPAFWEVVERSPETAVTLQLLTEQLDAGFILGKTILRTDTTSFHRNQQKLYWAGLHLFRTELDAIARKGWEAYAAEKRILYAGETKGKLYHNPGPVASLRIGGMYLLRLLQRRLRKLFFREQWQLAYRFSSNNGFPFQFELSRRLVPPRDRIWADPFLLYRDATWYLFFEEKLFREPAAHISLLRISAQGELLDREPRPVMQEPYHLSYPFVLELKGATYMLPEAAASGTVVLYQATEFPVGWKAKRVLLEGVKAYDATLHRHTDGYWYLFCTVKEDDRYSSDACLHIYYSSDLLEQPFQPHPLNPVYRDVRCSRPAGPLFYDANGHLVRPAQNSTPHYGASIRFFRVAELSTTAFREEWVAEQFPPSGSRSTHSFHSVNGLQVTDIQVRRSRFF